MYTVQCAGVYDRKFEELHNDRHAGGTAADALYRKVKAEKDTIDNDVIKSEILCSCCHDYKTWKVMHPSYAERLVEFASKPFYYRVEADKVVTVTEDGRVMQYKGTIHSTSCSGTAVSFGKHPFQCAECYSLVHGKSSPLLRKLNLSEQLKHPRSEPGRAGQRGVTHKFCSKESIESTLQIQNKKGYKLKESNDKIRKAVA